MLFPGQYWTIWLHDLREEWEKHERGSLPTVIEMMVIIWVQVIIKDNKDPVTKLAFLLTL